MLSGQQRVLNSWFPQQNARCATRFTRWACRQASRSSRCRSSSGSPTVTLARPLHRAGGIGVLFGALWWAFYREPRESSRESGRARLHRGGRRLCQGRDRADACVVANILCVRLRPILIISSRNLRQHRPGLFPPRLRELLFTERHLTDQDRFLCVVPFAAALAS
jgi:hypothetical protein